MSRILFWRRLNLATAGITCGKLNWQTSLPYLYDHRIQGTAILAASAYLELALAAAAVAFEDALHADDIDFSARCFCLNGSQTLQVTLSPLVMVLALTSVSTAL